MAYIFSLALWIRNRVTSSTRVSQSPILSTLPYLFALIVSSTHRWDGGRGSKSPPCDRCPHVKDKLKFSSCTYCG